MGLSVNKAFVGTHKKGIQIVTGTYGANCEDTDIGNSTPFISAICNDQIDCTFVIDKRVIGDPAPNCDKNFVAQWHCGDESKTRTGIVEPEAGNRKELKIHC